MNDADTIRREAEQILALSTGPWSDGEGVPKAPVFREALMLRFEHLANHARAILAALGEEPTS